MVEKDFWELFPEARIGIIVARGIDNQGKDREFYEKQLKEAQAEALKHLAAPQFTENKVIRDWREAFKTFKTKKGARASIEALLKRVSKGNPIGTINPLVDLYNAVSLRHALPVGGEDMDRFEGDIRLTKATGKENFIPLGETENAPPYEGEVVYKDEAGAICRCFNWREAERTMLRESTKNALLLMEILDPADLDPMTSALAELAGEVESHLGGDTLTAVLDRENPSFVIMD
jgi:DNA/RNA-binding domain of Phe-tRNA-synthetase-like protein